MNVDIEKCFTINIIYFIKCINFIENTDKIYSLYMHNISAMIIIGYLIWKIHTNFDEVFNYVKQRRYCIGPINPFIIQLKNFIIY